MGVVLIAVITSGKSSANQTDNVDGGSVGHWTFDEPAGSIVYDTGGAS